MNGYTLPPDLAAPLLAELGCLLCAINATLMFCASFTKSGGTRVVYRVSASLHALALAWCFWLFCLFILRP